MCNRLLKLGFVIVCMLVSVVKSNAINVNDDNKQLLKADTLYANAEAAMNEGRLEEAYTSYFQALQIRWNYLGKDDVKVADAIYGCSLTGMQLGISAKQFTEIMEIGVLTYKKTYGEERKEYLDAALLLAVLYGQAGENDRALSLHYSCMNLKYNHENKRSLEYLMDLFYEVEMMLRLERWDEGKAIEKEVFEIASEISTGDTLVFSLNQAFARVYKKCEMNDRATYYSSRNVELAKTLWGENTIQYIQALMDKGLAAYDLMPLESVADIFYEALAILKRNNLTSERDVYAMLLWHLSFVCFDQMQYADAIEYGMESINLGDDNSLGKGFAKVQVLTESFRSLGQQEKAIELLEVYLNVVREKIGVVSNEYLNALRMQGELYFDLQEWDKGMDKMTLCTSIAEEANAPWHEAKCSVSICEAMTDKANTKAYNNILNRGLKIARENRNTPTLLSLLLSAENQLFASVMKNEGIVGDIDTIQILDAAKPIFHEVDSIFALPMYDVMNISDVNRKFQHDTNKLIVFHLSEITKKGTFFESPQMMDELGKLQVAKSNVLFEQFNKNLRNLTRNERAYYVNCLAEELNSLVQVPIITEGRLGNAACYDALLQYRGAALQSDLSIQNTIFDSHDDNLIETYLSMRNHQNQLQKLCEMNASDSQHLVDSLQTIIDQQERTLITQSKDYGNFVKELQVTWKDIERTLKEDEIAIETYALSYGEGKIAYVAFLIRKDWEAPRSVILFDEKVLHGSDVYSTDTLYKAFVKNLTQYLQGVTTIYLVADGLFNSVALENIPTDAERCTLGEKYKMYRLSSTRELVRAKAPAQGDFAVFGGANFDVYSVDDVQKSLSPASYKSKERVADASILYRGALSELPGTLIESEYISDILLKSGHTPFLYVEDNATEESFKGLSGKPLHAIHIATHGFYWKEQDLDSTRISQIGFLHSFSPTTLSKYRSKPSIQEDKVLTRNGLLLCGANNALLGKAIPSQCEDGVLTAMEISRLDFRKTNLVTLSACETGLGENTSDGVFGLQRGFKKAGVNTILMSLWKVDDEATCKLMTEFYTNWIAKQMTKYDALETAKKVVRETKGWEDPKYWAAFILLDALD